MPCAVVVTSTPLLGICLAKRYCEEFTVSGRLDGGPVRVAVVSSARRDWPASSLCVSAVIIPLLFPLSWVYAERGVGWRACGASVFAAS